MLGGGAQLLFTYCMWDNSPTSKPYRKQDFVAEPNVWRTFRNVLPRLRKRCTVDSGRRNLAGALGVLAAVVLGVLFQVAIPSLVLVAVLVAVLLGVLFGVLFGVFLWEFFGVLAAVVLLFGVVLLAGGLTCTTIELHSAYWSTARRLPLVLTRTLGKQCVLLGFRV